MCFKNGKQLDISNCLAYKLINKVINWSLGSYLCEKKLSNTRKYLIKNLNFVKKKYIFLTTQITCANKSLSLWAKNMPFAFTPATFATGK